MNDAEPHINARDRLLKYIGRTVPRRLLPSTASNALTRRLFLISSAPARQRPREIVQGGAALAALDARVQNNLRRRPARLVRRELISSWESPEVLFDYALATGARTIVELGTRECHSTQALVRAASLTGGRVFSYDPERYTGRIEERYLSRWEFHQQTGEDGYREWDKSKRIDLLFIDTDPHSYEQTAMWLSQHWIDSLAPGALILLDDAAAWVDPQIGFGVNRAAHEFVVANTQRIEFAVLEAARPPANGLFAIRMKA